MKYLIQAPSSIDTNDIRKKVDGGTLTMKDQAVDTETQWSMFTLPWVTVRYCLGMMQQEAGVIANKLSLLKELTTNPVEQRC